MSTHSIRFCEEIRKYQQFGKKKKKSVTWNCALQKQLGVPCAGKQSGSNSHQSENLCKQCRSRSVGF